LATLVEEDPNTESELNDAVAAVESASIIARICFTVPSTP
jgi:hypothetical protein